MKGNAWLVGGAFAYLPDSQAGADYRMGIGNFKGADGVVFDTGGLCMRMFAQWEGDWWVRNGIGAPTNPEVRDAVAQRRPDLPPCRSRSRAGVPTPAKWALPPSATGRSCRLWRAIRG